jgi:L-glutamine-phosphate cytidylyltransferase
MKVIILAAGQGTRLRPLTNDRPKCMVELLGKPLIKHQLDVLNRKGIDNIYVATGYLEEKIMYPQIKAKYFNPRYDKTNMVVSLFSALEIMDGDDLLITYGDIVYSEDVIEEVLNDNSKIGVVVDKGWRAYWEARMDNPLDDAETLKVNDEGQIIEIGKKAKSTDEIQGQYIGMIKINKDYVSKFISFYNDLDKNGVYDGQDFDNMYMTSFLQKITEELIPLKPIYINNGWVEIDEPTDLEFTQFLNV